MLRNREALFFSLVAVVITVAATLICQFAILPATAVCISGCLGITVACIVYTHRRYRSIAQLNTYLQQLSHGKKALDIRDNTEGELSILKNEIYKVTATLTEQASSLAVDKRELANTLADISHQLKTPLTAVGVMADLLDDSQLPAEKRQEFIENIRLSINRMEWLVLTLLKLARLDASAVDLRRDLIMLSTLTERALSPLLIPVEVREQTVSVAGQDATVVCDPEWTTEALGNVLKNAMENTPTGGNIEIQYGQNPLYTFIAVRDSGSGIDQADLPHLFKRFYRGKNASIESAGIGLSMSLAVMQKQHGDIEVTNDKGSVFTLKFYQKSESDKNVTEKFTEL